MFEIDRNVRQNLLDGLRIEGVSWSGKLDEVEFLSRIYDLEALPSYDNRFKTATGDIWQHRLNNFDWDDDWVYGDPRINLLDGSSDNFLKFLCEMLHPVVRPDAEEALRLAGQINDQLRRAGVELAEVERIAGRPKFEAKALGSGKHQAVKRGEAVADALSAGWMRQEIERLEEAIESDPALAIGTAKDLVESCCKTILGKLGIDVPKGANLQKLTKMVCSELKLVPEGIPDETRGAEKIRLVLSNLSAITANVAELRGLYGTGHGRDGGHRGLQVRHARLVAGAAVTFVDFISATFAERHGPPSSKA
jgi:HEPN domain-containing protein